MNKLLVIGILAALTVPVVASAIPNAQTGTQSGNFWSQSTAVAAQGGTRFALLGAIGDHDIVFLDANGAAVGFSIACGPDTGTVPASAVTALILVWDTGSVPGTCVGVPNAGASQWVYVDGL